MKYVVFSLLLSGCATQAPATESLTVQPLEPANGVENVTMPSIHKAYYVGQIIDPAHPELMYRPGIVIREELPERWNRNPVANAGTVTGTLNGIPDPAILPPSTPEMEQLVAQQRQVMELLGQANRTLTEQLSEPTTKATPPSAGEQPGPVAPPTPPVPNPAQALDLTRATVPNADGAIELSPDILDAVDRVEPNPFQKRYQTQTPLREIVVNVLGTSLGPKPTANVNGHLLNTGDSWEGFAVAAITRDAVYLQKDLFLLQIPVARPKGITVRLPQ